MRCFMIASLVVWTVPAFAADVCVTNADSGTYLFAVEAKDGDRTVETLTRGQSLCVPNPALAGGIVSVFESVDAEEGCSRLVARPGGTRTLLRYVSFDRCAWDDNTR